MSSEQLRRAGYHFAFYTYIGTAVFEHWRHKDGREHTCPSVDPPVTVEMRVVSHGIDGSMMPARGTIRVPIRTPDVLRFGGNWTESRGLNG